MWLSLPAIFCSLPACTDWNTIRGFSFEARGEVRAGDAAQVAQMLKVPRRQLQGTAPAKGEKDEDVPMEPTSHPVGNKKGRGKGKSKNENKNGPPDEAEKVGPLDVMDKASDLRARALAKANHAGSIMKQLKTVTYAAECLKEVTSFETEFQCLC